MSSSARRPWYEPRGRFHNNGRAAKLDRTVHARARSGFDHGFGCPPLGEDLTAKNRVSGIFARKGKLGLGNYVTQEAQVLNAKLEVVMVRRQTTVRFPGG